MLTVTQNLVQVTNVKHGKFASPLISFTLSWALPDPADPHDPYVVTMAQCVAKTYKNCMTPDNPHGWRWTGPPKWEGKTRMVTVIRMNPKMQKAVLGLLNREGHLKVAERLNAEWFEARWRVPNDDESLKGILLK